MNVPLCLGAFILLQNFMPGGSTRHGIIGGRESDPRSHPYMVYLTTLDRKISCDGFLVNENFVMTAAHCRVHIAFVEMHNISRLHINNAMKIKLVPYPRYNKTCYKDDIMLLKLEKTVEFNDLVKPIALPKSTNQHSPSNCLVMGWGRQSYNKNDPSKILLEVNVTISDNYCNDHNVICTGGEKGPGEGDSGGPLVCGDVAHGIVSTYIKCCGGHVSKYTRIDHYLHWIEKVLNGTYKED